MITNWKNFNSHACTAFQINHSGDVFVGKNYDWIVGDGIFVVNKRGVSKEAVPTFFDKKIESGRLVRWISKYGSVSHNQFGREWPFGGMNEAGLVVESLAYPGTQIHKPDDRPSISALQFGQYLLDNYSSVKEVLDCEETLRIRPTIKPAGHMFVADKNGNTTVIEYINGKRVYYANDTLPYKVLTNSAYQTSVGCYRKNRKPRRDKGKSILRFMTAAKMLQAYDDDSATAPLDYAFKILENVSWKERIAIGKFIILMETKWSFVYDVNHLRIYFRTHHNPNIRMINIESFDFSCITPVMVSDINTSLSGDVTNAFTEYTPQINSTLVKTVFKNTPYPFLYGLDFKFFFHFIKSGFSEFPEHPEENMDALLAYPDKTVCIGNSD